MQSAKSFLDRVPELVAIIVSSSFPGMEKSSTPSLHEGEMGKKTRNMEWVCGQLLSMNDFEDNKKRSLMVGGSEHRRGGKLF